MESIIQPIPKSRTMLDIFTDIFCVAFPLGYSRFYLAMPIQLQSMLFIVVYPTLSLLSKLKGLWWDYFKVDLERIQKNNLSKNRNQGSSVSSSLMERLDRRVEGNGFLHLFLGVVFS